ncbi:hypothetical protein T459_09120 [Capsicum annuum]|uniref:NADP-dependent oxidoreductase domain-containing protein n=1 Tax=Capsicum annuum TaxID=4072 RepID=A0A2G2ZYH1_CAPAN|nr:hypothetical protein T459_09120 [Capsicum annuum]
MEYVDVYYVHWPVDLKPWVDYPIPQEEDFEELDMENTWSSMDRFLEMGLCRSIAHRHQQFFFHKNTRPARFCLYRSSYQSGGNASNVEAT